MAMPSSRALRATRGRREERRTALPVEGEIQIVRGDRREIILDSFFGIGVGRQGGQAALARMAADSPAGGRRLTIPDAEQDAGLQDAAKIAAIVDGLKSA